MSAELLKAKGPWASPCRGAVFVGPSRCWQNFDRHQDSRTLDGASKFAVNNSPTSNNIQSSKIHDASGLSSTTRPGAISPADNAARPNSSSLFLSAISARLHCAGSQRRSARPKPPSHTL